MMGIIGYQDDIIGFGLAGIEKMIELKRSASQEEILQAVRDLEVKTLIIAEEFHARVRDAAELKGVFVIEIPQDKKAREDPISALAKELLGITFEEP